MKNNFSIKIILFTLLFISCESKRKNQIQKNKNKHICQINKSETLYKLYPDTPIFMHFNYVYDILNFDEDEVMLISDEYFPNICFSKDGTLTMIFSASEGAIFDYKATKNKIKVFFKKNEIFNDFNPPDVGLLLFEIELTNDSTFSVYYFQKKWINQINSENEVNGHTYFPIKFHCIDP